MVQLDFLRDLLIIYVVAGVVVYVFERAQLPAIVGLLVAGVIVGPYGLSLIDDISRVEVLADIGVVLLLFTVGLEFTRERLAGAGHLLGVGSLQVLFAIVGTALFLRGATENWGQAIFAGFLVAHTSTTVLLKLLLDRGELGTLQAKIAVAISIIQDLSIVWMIVLVPALAGGAVDWGRLSSTLVGGVFAVAALLLAARFVLPAILVHVVGLRSRELFLILLVVVSMGTAWLTAEAGLSLALGAFLAGVALAESEYSHQTLAEAIPFRDVFVILFFVSIGMLFDARFLVRHPWGVLGLVGGVLVLKFLSGALPTLWFGYSWRVAALVGVSMAQIGEFAFVLGRTGHAAGLLPDEAFQALLAAALITIGLAPFLLRAAPALIDRAEQWPWISRRLAARVAAREAGQIQDELADHAILVGYGVNGRTLARSFREVPIPVVTLELNPARVRQARQAGVPVVFGDSTRPSVLRQVGIERAGLIVIAISDPASTLRTVRLARQLNPRLRIVVRTRYLSEIDTLQRHGADEIVSEESEASIEILSLVLAYYGLDLQRIQQASDQVRQGHYLLLRRPPNKD